ncbi:MAG: lipid IV(A) 3-deoxy-D-manno-octulosonic acid transferase [Halioglobus sp.]
MRYLYSAVLYLLIPFILVRMLLRSRNAPAYRRRLAERFGFFSDGKGQLGSPAIWVHAVSLGETIAAAPVVEDLLERYPEHTLVLTTTTPTGSERARALFGARVLHVYAPWDLPGAVKRFVKKVQPELLVIMETELWPNMLHYSAVGGAKIILANARMSERSASGYLRFSTLSKSMLSKLTKVACQSPDDGRRMIDIGLAREKLEITGSIKFDLELSSELREQSLDLKKDWGLEHRPALVAASTHPGEDEIILKAFAALKTSMPNCLLLLVPRHPERFETVFELCRAEGWQVKRRSQGIAPGQNDDIVVGDTMGELLLLLSLGKVAIIGGSLVEHGGHNALEASAWGVPVVTGPAMFNFAEISDLLCNARAMIKLNRAEDLGDTLQELLRDQQRLEDMGASALGVVADNRGAKKRLMALIDEQMSAAR